MSVSPRHGTTSPVSRAAVSIRRSAVVPTGMIRPPGRAGGGDLGGGCLAHLAPFGMHPVAGDVVDLDRQEGARPDMQRDMGEWSHPAPPDRASTTSSKCRLAVGAATAPGRRAQTV